MTIYDEFVSRVPRAILEETTLVTHGIDPKSLVINFFARSVNTKLIQMKSFLIEIRSDGIARGNFWIAREKFWIAREKFWIEGQSVKILRKFVRD